MATENTPKITKRDYYNTLAALISYCEQENIGLPDGMTYKGLTGFVDHEVELLDNKAAAAAKRAAAKKAEGDALRDLVYNTMSDTEPMTIREIADAIGDEDVTVAKVTARLTQLKSLGLVEKTEVEGKKGSAYRKIG